MSRVGSLPLLAALLAAALDLHSAAAQRVGAGIQVAPSGETLVLAKSGRLKVEVSIIAEEVGNGIPSSPYSSCTGARHPCSLILALGIRVGGKSLSIPRSVSCDLADVVTAELLVKNREFLLILRGGDAGDSYVVSIAFDKERVKRKRRASGFDEDRPLEETVYHADKLIDG